jgi:hypothetical protein
MRSTAVLVGVLTAVMLGACGGSQEPTDKQSRQQSSPGGIHRGLTRLESADLGDGREVVLRSSLSRGVDPSAGEQCLSLVGLDAYTRQCGNAFESEGKVVMAPVVAQSIAQKTGSAPLEVYGATSAKTDRVSLEYRAGGSQREEPAVLLRVTDEEALQRAGIPGRFGYFFGELPSAASRVKAIALDRPGDRLGSASFERFIRTLNPHVFIEEELPSDRRGSGRDG